MRNISAETAVLSERGEIGEIIPGSFRTSPVSRRKFFRSDSNSNERKTGRSFQGSSSFLF